MQTRELLQRVRRIEIKTRGLSRNIFSGHYHSAFKGRGMAFSEVREYQIGDDVRSIDWNVTARFGHPFIKIFEEERELTVMLLIDVSGSNAFGTRQQLKEQMITEIAAVLSFSAIHNNDKVGVIFFSDKVEKFIPPLKGKTHTLRIIRELIDFKPDSNQTDIREALRFLTNAIKKRATAFVISDFMDKDFDKALSIANNKHDVVAIRIIDPAEQALPNVGMMKMQDAESKEVLWVDTSSKQVAKKHFMWWQQLNQNYKLSCRKAGVDQVEISINKDFVKPLVNLFKVRQSRF
ncbi:MAG: DUF58 domain-containing protein [Bacteroidales bacterium]